MFGQMRDSSAARRRKWWDALSPEEKDLEDRYQRMVDRRYFSLLPFCFLTFMGTVWLLRDRPLILGPLAIPGFFWMMLSPFFFIPTSRKWKAKARAKRDGPND